MLVTFPFVLLLLDYWPLQRISFEFVKRGQKQAYVTRITKQIGLCILEKVPLLCIAILAWYLASQLLAGMNNLIPFSLRPFSLRVENVL